MTVDLGDGYRAIYGQLKEPNFAVGDYVESGHVLGYVAEPTKYYSVEGSNLYFALQKDGQPVDPVAFFQSWLDLSKIVYQYHREICGIFLFIINILIF